MKFFGKIFVYYHRIKYFCKARLADPEGQIFSIKKYIVKTNTPARPLIRVYKKGQEPDDVAYWQGLPAVERILALEEIRKQYNDWKYGTGREFQRVYKIAKRKRG